MNDSQKKSYTWISILATIQGIYYIITGIWPLIHIESFMAVTGPKTDLWLVKTVGVLVVVIGLALIAAVAKQRITFPIVIIAMGSALGLFFIDVIYVWSKVISSIYLLDAFLELILAISWIFYLVKSSPRATLSKNSS